MVNQYVYDAELFENDADGNTWVGFKGTNWQYLYGSDGYPIAKFPVLIDEHCFPEGLDSMAIGRFANAAGRAKFHESPRSYGVKNYEYALNMILTMCRDKNKYDDVIALMRMMNRYGVSILHAYDEGISVSELNYLDSLGDKQLPIMLDLLDAERMYESRKDSGSDDSHDTETKNRHAEFFQRLPWVADCDTANKRTGERLIVVDYPVFTSASISIMKIFGMKRIYDFVISADNMNYDVNGCTREQVYAVIRGIIDSRNIEMADCLLNVIGRCTGSAPLITSDVMTIEWVRSNSAIPPEIMVDNLDSGMYTKTGSRVDDMYYEMLNRIMGELDDSDTDAMGIGSGESRLIPPNVRSMTIAEYVQWLSNHRDMVYKCHESIIRNDLSLKYMYHTYHYDGLERIAAGHIASERELNEIASKYIAIGLMRNRYDAKYMLGNKRAVTMQTGKLLNRFMGYMYTLCIDHNNNNAISPTFMNRIINTVRMILELDDESFTMLANIRCTAYRTRSNIPYVQTPVWFQDKIGAYSQWFDISEDIKDELFVEADESMFPMGMNRMLGMLENALTHGSEGIKRLDALCRNIVINDSQYGKTNLPPTRYRKSVHGSNYVIMLKSVNLYSTERDWLKKGKPITKIRVNNEEYMRSTRTSRTIDLTNTPYWLPM